LFFGVECHGTPGFRDSFLFLELGLG